MMIPITRKEKYINEIVGGGDTAPKTPQTREEFFFADILGEVIAPSPVTRAEKYLSAIAGQYGGDLPTPITRIEYFLARAAGMEIETPIPITREEMLWDTYIPIKTIEGIPPLTFKAKKAGTLKDYRIYGNTAGGESVGDKTENLFDGELTDGYHLSDTTGLPVIFARRFATLQPITINQSEYCLTYNSTTDLRFMYSVFNNDTLIRRVAIVNNRYLQSGDAIDTTGGNKIYFAFYNNDYSHASTGMISNIMLNEGSTAIPYEPYGYKVPVTVSNGTDTLTTPIYLPEPIKMVGDEAEYIDYEEQKQNRVRKNLFNIETDIISLGFQYGTVVIFSDPTVKGFLKECEPNTAYTISRKTSSNNRFSIGFSAEEPSNTSTVVLLSYTTPLDTSTTSLTSISPANAKYICCYLSNRGDDITEALEIMLEKNDRATDYEPYITNTDLDVTLPALPTLSGTNVLSVGTEVQPSKVYVKYKGERQ